MLLSAAAADDGGGDDDDDDEPLTVTIAPRTLPELCSAVS